MRKRLLDAAVKVIVNRGYLRFTTLEAVKVAGVTRGAAHHHFGSADGFLLAALEHLFAETKKESEQTIAHFTTPDDLLRALAADARRFYFGQAFFGGLDALLSATKDARTRSAVRDLGHRYRLTNEEMWRDHLVGLGIAPADAENAVGLLLAVVRGMAIRTLLRHSPKRIDELIELALAMAQNYLADRVDRSWQRPSGKARAGEARDGG